MLYLQNVSQYKRMKIIEWLMVSGKNICNLHFSQYVHAFFKFFQPMLTSFIMIINNPIHIVFQKQSLSETIKHTFINL